MKKIVIPFLFLPLASTAQNIIGFEEGIPQGFMASKDGTVSVTDKLYKEGTKSLEWKFGANSVINIKPGKPIKLNPKTEAKSGTTLWIYNETKAQDSLRFEFLDDKGIVRYSFAYKLASKGWRACWIGFKSMDGIKLNGEEEVNISSCRIIAPDREGTIYIDRWKMLEKNMNQRTTPDMQISCNSLAEGRELWHWCRVWEWEQYKSDIARPEMLSDKQTADLKTIENNLDKACAVPANYETYIKKAKRTFEKAGIKVSGGGFIGSPIVAPDEQNKKKGEMSWTDIETMLAGFAYETICNGSDEAKNKYFIVWRYAIDQGFAYGSGMGTNHHYGYRIRKIYPTAWLMRNHIQASDVGCNIIEALVFWSALQETRKPCPDTRDEMLDTWHTLLEAKLIAAMMIDDDKDKVQALQGLSRWVSGSTNYSPGTIGGIKIDGTTFHHGGFYPGYSTGALASVADYVAMTSGTDFVPTKDARIRLAKGMRAMRNYCNLLEWTTGLGGRHPFSGKMKQEDIQAFAKLSLAGDLSEQGHEFDHSLAADYLRLVNGKDTKEAKFFKSKGITPAHSPQGFFVYNYGAAGIFRRNNWMVTLKGYNTNVWGSEIYARDNRYGRYQSYGSVQIMSGQSRHDSGYTENGWDWNRLPGTTSIHLPLELLESPKPGTLMARSKEEYAGASSLEGKNGMFSMKLAEADYQNFTSDFVGRKSVFCFNSHMICLGTGISNSNTNYPTETTLFQSEYRGDSTAIMINNKTINSTSFTQDLKGGKDCWLKDGYGNIYNVYKGDVTVTIAEQKSRNEKTKHENKGIQASAVICHGFAPQGAEYEYCVWIQPSEKDLKKAKSRKVYSVLRQDDAAHIVKDHESGITAYSAFDNVSMEKESTISFIQAETMMMQRRISKHEMVVSVCDPNLNISEKTYTTSEQSSPLMKRVVINGIWKLADDCDKVSLHSSQNKTELIVKCQHGIPVEFRLKK